MKLGWLVYESADLEVNRDFASYVEAKGEARGIKIETVRTAQLSIGMRSAEGFWRTMSNCGPDHELLTVAQP